MNAPSLAKCEPPAQSSTTPEEASLILYVARLEDRLRKANEEIGALRWELARAKDGAQ